MLRAIGCVSGRLCFRQGAVKCLLTHDGYLTIAGTTRAMQSWLNRHPAEHSGDWVLSPYSDLYGNTRYALCGVSRWGNWQPDTFVAQGSLLSAERDQTVLASSSSWPPGRMVVMKGQLANQRTGIWTALAQRSGVHLELIDALPGDNGEHLWGARLIEF